MALLQSWRNAKEVKQRGSTSNIPSHEATWAKPSSGR